jgi:hypothetical protein
MQYNQLHLTMDQFVLFFASTAPTKQKSFDVSTILLPIDEL